MFEDEILESWKNELSSEIDSDYFNGLLDDVLYEYEYYSCLPPENLIFAAFDKCLFNDVKVVIIGQDPYHGVGEANGLCFSVNDGIKIPPSLRNIFKEINNDFGQIMMPTSGNLERWANQGVLLLNNTLTVREKMPNSHSHLDWKVFTDHVIELISDKKENIVFMLWGNFAQKKGAKIDRNKHLVLEAGHPSPMSANQGKWFGCKHFSKTNNFLLSKNIEPIVW
jgi:uracil-DNA glycosylase